MVIMMRRLYEVNTDPQRRCYYGCHAKSELIWSEWEELERTNKEKAQKRLEFWKNLNDYAVSQRGKANTLCEFRLDDLE